MSRTYDDYRRQKIESGTVYQDYIVDVLRTQFHWAITTYSSRLYQQTKGEGPSCIEIKHDEKYADTGNLWIEVAEKAHPRPGPFAPSGIYRDDNSILYVIGDYKTVFLFMKSTLRAICAAGRYRIRENGTGTSEGFLFPDREARAVAGHVLALHADGTVVQLAGDLAALGRFLLREARADRRQLNLPLKGTSV